MISYLLAGPAQEPVALSEAKAFLKVDDAAEDGLITTLIGAARLHIEGVTGRALLAQDWRVVLDAWPEDRLIRLPVAPLLNLITITAYDDAGTGHAVPLAPMLTEPGALLLPASLDGLPALRARLAIEVDYRAGYGATPSAVPRDLIQALLQLVAHWYEHRDAVIVAGSGAVVPSGFDRLVAAHRRVRL